MRISDWSSDVCSSDLLAYMLQFKPGKAMETAGRFTINTTLGVAGLFDVAKRKPFFLPYRPNGLANVLGYYGVGPGPYMYLPRSEEHTSELQSLMRISYAVFCLKKKTHKTTTTTTNKLS